VKNLLIRLLINALSLLVASEVVNGIFLSRDFLDIMIVAFIFGLVNALIKPVVQLFALPLIFLTLGLITILINAFMLLLTDVLTESLSVDGFFPALLGSVIISLVSMFLNIIFKDERKRSRN
jgi:putative membrane protein